jgi:hypothetical protein
MNLVEFRGRYEGEEVWHVDAVTWDTVFEQQEPYASRRREGWCGGASPDSS